MLKLNRTNEGHNLCKKEISKKREELIIEGNSKITPNIFIDKEFNITILKSVVKTTNKHEILSLSLTKNIFEKIKDKFITIEVFERNCYRSIQIKRYKIRVLLMFETDTYRCKKNKTMRYNLLTYEDFINNENYQIKIIS